MVEITSIRIIKVSFSTVGQSSSLMTSKILWSKCWLTAWWIGRACSKLKTILGFKALLHLKTKLSKPCTDWRASSSKKKLSIKALSSGQRTRRFEIGLWPKTSRIMPSSAWRQITYRHWQEACISWLGSIFTVTRGGLSGVTTVERNKTFAGITSLSLPNKRGWSSKGTNKTHLKYHQYGIKIANSHTLSSPLEAAASWTSPWTSRRNHITKASTQSERIAPMELN